MAFFKWNPAFSVGVVTFDREHMGLIEMINDLHDAMRDGKGKDGLDVTVARLIDYTTKHLEHEEGELKKHGYPQLREHCRQHEELKLRVREFRNRLTIGYNGLITVEMARFLKTWLEQHILREDMHYSQFLGGKGVR
jgi:hemerythrin